MNNKTQIPHLRLVDHVQDAFVQDEWAAEQARDEARRREERMARQTPKEFEEELVLNPDYANGQSREEDSSYHIFQGRQYTTLPHAAPKIDLDLK